MRGNSIAGYTGRNIVRRMTAAIPSYGSSGFVKDPARLTRFLLFMLWAHIGISGLAILLSIVSLGTGHAGQPETEEFSVTDLLTLLVALPQLLIILVTGITFLMWIHRANRNARGLGAQGMTFTPGWSVGWYFIPFANLWKPYQAMKQIWQASANPTSWQDQKPPALLPNWWALWIISTMLSNASFRLSMRAKTSSALITSEAVSLISDAFDIVLCIVAMRLVREVIRLQTQWVAQSALAAQSSCVICGQAKVADMIYLNGGWVCAECKPIMLQRMREGAIES